MIKKIGLGLLVGMFIFGACSFVLAQSEEYDTKAGASKAVKAENVGNKICPVNGEEINEKMKATYEYQGKIYNFCCAGCIEEFKKDPEKYISKVNEEMKGEMMGEMKEEETIMHESMP
ncbi:MAG: YHS domain-containing protein [Candidatus Omnitrophota bacterium]